MKFLIDAHLPKSLCRAFEAAGHEAIHTRFLPLGNATPDARIAQLAAEEGIAVVSKDSDFFHSFLLKKMPPKLVMVKTGNLRLAETRGLFQKNARLIADLLTENDLVEVHRDRVVAVS